MDPRLVRSLTLSLLLFWALVFTALGVWFSASLAAWITTGRFVWIGLGAALFLPLLFSLGNSFRFFLKSLIASNAVMVVVSLLVAPGIVKQALQEHGDWPAQAFSAYLAPQQQSTLKKTFGAFSGWFVSYLPDGPGIVSQLAPEPPTPAGTIKPAKGQKTSENAVVKFKKSGSTMVVNVNFENKLTVPMIYDTGASITTLDAATAKRLGITGRPARYVEVETANGITRQPIVKVSSIEVGGARVEGPLEVAICNTCSLSGASGLLGLNFSKAFITQIDPQAGTITFLPRK